MLNNVCLQGRLVEDPELKTTTNGISVCTERLAVERSYCKSGETRKVDFINFTVWKNNAEFLAKYFKKGQLIIITGSLQQRSWKDKNGNNRSNIEVLAEHIEFSESKSAASTEAQTSAKTTQASQASGKATPFSTPINTSNQPSANDDFEEIPSDDDLPF